MKPTKKSRLTQKPKKTKNKKPLSVKSNPSFPIVGVGASAGGLEAFIALLSKMPVDTGMAFILIQHLDPTHPSLSTEIISRSTKLRIEEVADKTRIKPNHIYVIPPNYNMKIRDGVLNLTVRIEGPSPNMSIDFFFQSLAEVENGRVVGIILSGTGADGTVGLRAIQAEGGITFAQDPKTAKYRDMPQSAIDAGVIDLVLRPEDIAIELARIANYPNLAINKADKALDHQSQVAMRNIFDLLLKQTKIDFNEYKPATIKRRIQRRMIVHKTKTWSAYANYLAAHDEEVIALYKDVLINVTEFFRDRDSFDALKTVVFPTLVKNNAERTAIRIWVPGCSTGEEVYSIAISLIEFLNAANKNIPIQIFATDISDQALAVARKGQYSETLLQGVSKEQLKNFFEKVEGGYKIRKSVRDLCLFSKHDLASDPPFGKLDLISCRNLLIYFSAASQNRIFPIFHYALNSGGFLWLGKSESPGELPKLFNWVERFHKIFSKSGIPTPIPLHLRLPKKRSIEFEHESSANEVHLKPHEVDFRKDADKLILSQFAPPSVVVNADLEILQFRGRTVPFLEPVIGHPSLNLFKMARPEIVSALRATIQAVKKENKPVIRHGLQFEAEGKNIKLDIEVLPTNPLVEPKHRTFLVIFKPRSEAIKATTGKQIKIRKNSQKLNQDEKDRQIIELTNELSEMKDYLKSLVQQYEFIQEELTAANEELQSTNEEFKSTNEEFQSTNEEFQSTNEELQTTQEELQSTNEELVTVNDELQIRNADLTTLSSDLNNLLASIEIPFLIMGGDHNVRLFSPKNKKSAFNLIPTDIGRPVSDIKPDFDLNLDALVTEVIEDLIPRAIETQDLNGKWLSVQIRPYKTVDNKIDGAIVTLIDIDFLKQKEIKTKELLEYFKSVAETVPMPLAVINSKLQIQSANQSFYNYFQLSDRRIGHFFSTLKIRETSLQNLGTLVSLAMKENKHFADFETDCEVPQLGTRKLLLSGGKIHWNGTEQEAVLVSFVDVTVQRLLDEELKHIAKREKEARNQAEQANKSKDLFLATLSHELRTPLTSILTWAQLISQGKVDFEKAKHGAAVIEKCAKTQNQLINDLLDISRVVAGKLNLKIQAVETATVIQAAIEAVRSLADDKSIQIKTSLGNEPATIYADPIRLQQIVWNLLTNAIKFSSEKGVIDVELKCLGEKNARFVQITVSDHGKGISPEFLPQIFNQFSQADSATTRLHGGLGLGLSIVKNLVQLQNGTVKAENSQASHGAIFTVTFPLISSLAAAIRPTEVASEFDAQPKLDGLRVLIVDDDISTREAISIYLRSFGAEVQDVESAKAALNTFPVFKPDVLVSDIAMPAQDGYSLIREVRALPRQSGRDVPAVAVTAFANAEDARHALNAGFQAHMAKPVEPNELGRVILKILNAKN